ncbi:MAG: E3 binding domain-containing protein, partial [Armatimonadota bacterium]
AALDALQEQERPEWAPAESPRPDGRGLGKIKRVRAVPAARRIAREAGIDLADVAQALKEDRRITVADVEEFIRDGGRG